MTTQKTLHYFGRNKSNLKGFLCLILYFIFFYSIQAQTKADVKPLIEVLSKIEQQYDYKFTYADETISNIFVIPPLNTLSFEQTLLYLTEKTALLFNKVDDRFVSINQKSTNFVICGRIKDGYSKTPILNTTVRGKNFSTLTDDTGYFELEVRGGNETVIIGHLGYRTTYRLSNSFQEGDCRTIYLDSKIETLGEVVLKNYLTKGIDKTSNGNFQIDYSDFGMLPGLIETDVLQTIQALPGIQSADETVSNINIRGGTHDQNLILWDGIKMYQSGHFFGLISMFDPNITKSASLIKNGTTAEFGDGVSGTILMKTDPEVNTDFEVDLGLNLINVNGFVNIPIHKKTSLQVSARKAINNYIKTPTYTQYFKRVSQNTEVEENSSEVSNSDREFDFYDTSLRWIYNITDRDHLRVNYINIGNELVFMENAVLNSVNTSRQSSLRQNSTAASIFYQRYWNEKLTTSFQLYETDYKLESVNVNILDQQRFLQENKVSETSAKLNTRYYFHDHFSLFSGYQWTETSISNLNDVDVPVFRDKKVRVIRNHSLFSELGYVSDNEHTSLNIGIRYNYNEKFEAHIIEPRFSFSQKFLDYFNLEFLGEFKHQNTSHIVNFQNDFLGIEKRRWTLSGNDQVNDIPIIKSKQVSLGLSFDKQSWLVNVDGYVKTVDNITAKSQGFQNDYALEDAVGSYTVKGVDFLINKRFNDISAWFSYSMADNNFTFESFPEVNFPNTIEINHAITFGTSYVMDDFKFSAGMNWNSGLPTTKPELGNEIIDGRINYEATHSSRLAEYLRIDMSATYDFDLSSKIRAHSGISIWNLFGRENIINSFYQITEDNLPNQITKSSLGFTPNAIFSVSF